MENKERATRPPTIVGLPIQMIPLNGESDVGRTSDGDRDSTPDWSPDTVLWRSLPNSVVDNRSSRSSSGIPTSLTDSTIEEDSVGTAKSLMASSLYSTASSSLRLNPQLVNTRVEMVYSLLSTLASEDRDDVSATLESMTTSKESCLAMRQSGCIPLLVQLLHGLIDEHGNPKGRLRTRESRLRAAKALHNIVHALPDDKRSRREARVVKLLEQVREFCDALEEGNQESNEDQTQEPEHPTSAVAALMKLSFDEEHRHAICQLGGLQAIAELLHSDFAAHGHNRESCLLIRRYSGMALTNLTFGDGNNKAALCSMRSFMTSLVAQLDSRFDDLKQVTASVLRNLSWRADSMSRVSLRESGSVISLTKCMMSMEKEGTLKSVLSALWNLSAHCTENKVQICSVDGALGFLVGTLTYRSQGKTLSIVENGGGILRNVSSYVATQDEYRAILRRHSCLEILLQQLKSPSLTVVSNACGTLWNLSARCPQDQKRLWELGAVGMLRNLVNSKHKMISMGSSAALKNLLTAQHLSDSLECGGLESRLSSLVSEDLSLKSSETSSIRSCDTPVLLARKAKNLKQQYITGENAKNLSELCDNIEASPKASPVSEKRSLFFPSLPGRMHYSVGEHVPRSASRDSLRSTYSEPGYVRPRPHSLGQLRHSSIDRYSHIDWSTTSAFLASSEGTRAASARRRPASSSCVRPTSTYASFISTSIFEDKEEYSPTNSKHGTPHREPRKSTKDSLKDVKPRKDLSEKKPSIEKRSAVPSPMSGSLTDSQSSGSSPLKRSRIPQVKRPTESPPPPPTNKKKSAAAEHRIAGSASADAPSLPPAPENLTVNSPTDTLSSQSDALLPVFEKPPTVAVRSVKPVPTPPPSSPNFSSKKSSGNNNDSDRNSSSISEKSPPPSPRKSLTNKHLRAIEIEDDSSVASDLGGVQPPSFFNDLGSMASSCGSLELTGERSPAKKLSLQPRQCWNADEWSPKSCENLDNVMPPSGLNSVECLSLGSSMNSDMLLNANPPSFMDDHSFDDRTHDVIAAEETYTRDVVNHNEAPIYPRVNTATYTQQHPQLANSKPGNNCIAQLLDDPTEIGSDAFLSDVEGEDLPYDSSTEYYTCRQSTETLRASNFMSCNSGHTRDATVGSSENLTSLDNTLTFDVSGGRKNQNHNSCADLTYDATLVYEPADDECSVVSSVDDATYDISSPRPQTPSRGARIVKPVMVNGVAVMPGSPAKPPVVIITGKNSPKNSPKKVPAVPIRQTRASALRASRAQTPAELERSTSRSASSSPARSPPVSARLSSPANRRPLPRTASSPTSRTPIGGKAPQVASPLASRSSSLNSRVTSTDNMRPPAGSSKTQNENQPPKPALTKQGTFTKDSGELALKPAPGVPVVPARTTVPNSTVQNNQTRSNTINEARAPMHKSSSVSHNMTRSTHPTLNRAQSDAAQMSKSVVQAATQRVPLAMRTTAASRARAAAIAHAKAQPSQARVVLTRRATTSGERPTSNSVNNNMNNNNNYENDDTAVNRGHGALHVNDTSVLIRSGTYEKINEVGLTPYPDSNDNDKTRAVTTHAVRPSEFWTTTKSTTASYNSQKPGFLKRSVGGNRKVGDSSPVAAPRTIPGLRSPSEMTKLVGSSISNIASPAAVIAPFSYRPRSTPTTPNGSKIPMMRSEEKKPPTAADDEGYVVATARLVTTV